MQLTPTQQKTAATISHAHPLASPERQQYISQLREKLRQQKEEQAINHARFEAQIQAQQANVAAAAAAVHIAASTATPSSSSSVPSTSTSFSLSPPIAASSDPLLPSASATIVPAAIQHASTSFMHPSLLHIDPSLTHRSVQSSLSSSDIHHAAHTQNLATLAITSPFLTQSAHSTGSSSSSPPIPASHADPMLSSVSTIQLLTGQLHELQREKHEEKREVNDLYERIHQIQQQQMDSLRRCKLKESQLADEMEQATRECIQSKKAYSALQQQYQQLQTEYQSHLSTCQNQVHYSSAAYQQLLQQCTLLKEQYERVCIQYQHLQQQHDNNLASTRSNHNASQQQLANTREQYALLQQQHAQLQSQYDRLHQQSCVHNQDVQQLQQRIRDMEVQLHNASTSPQQIEQIRRELKQQYELQLQTFKMAELSRMRGEMEKGLKQAMEAQQPLLQRIEYLEQSIEQSRQQSGFHESNNHHLQQQIQLLMQQLQSSQQDYEILRIKYMTQSAAVSRLHGWLQSKERHLSEMAQTVAEQTELVSTASLSPKPPLSELGSWSTYSNNTSSSTSPAFSNAHRTQQRTF